MKNFLDKLKYAILGGLLIIAGTVLAAQISVPSAPSAGYMLVSTSTGNYIATSSSPLIVGSIYATSTTVDTYFYGTVRFPNLSPGLAKFNQTTNRLQTALLGTDYVNGSGTSGNCVQWGVSNALTDAGNPCGSGSSSFGKTFEISNGFLSPTTTIPIAITSTATSTFVGPLYAPRLNATTTVYTVAASNAPLLTKLQSDYVCTGTNDYAGCISPALTAALANNGTVKLSLGTFNIGNSQIAFNQAGACLSGTNMNGTIVTGSNASSTIHIGTRQAGGSLNAYECLTDMTVINTSTTGDQAVWIDGIGHNGYLQNLVVLNQSGGKYALKLEDIDRDSMTNIYAQGGTIAPIVSMAGLENTWSNFDAKDVVIVPQTITPTVDWLWTHDVNQPSAQAYSRINLENVHFFGQNAPIASSTGLMFLTAANTFTIDHGLFENQDFGIVSYVESDYTESNSTHLMNLGTATANIYQAAYATISLNDNTYEITTNVIKVPAGSGFPSFTFNGNNRNGGSIGSVFNSFSNIGLLTGTDALFVGDGVLSLGSGSQAMATINAKQLVLNGSATSTATKGIDIAGGCYAIGGTCIGSGTGTVTGTGAATRLAFWTGTNSQSSNANLLWDNTNAWLGIGAVPNYRLDMFNQIAANSGTQHNINGDFQFLPTTNNFTTSVDGIQVKLSEPASVAVGAATSANFRAGLFLANPLAPNVSLQNAYGVTGQVTLGANAQATSTYGVHAYFQNDGGHVNNAFAIFSETRPADTRGVIDDGVGLFVESTYLAGNQARFTGIKIPTNVAAASTSIGAEIADPVRFGDTGVNPTHAFEVNGTTNLLGLTGIATTTPFARFAINPVAGDANQFVVGSSSATSFIINNASNVGIGTNNPTNRLTVVSANASQAYFGSTGANNSVVLIDNAAGGNQSNIKFQDAGSNKFEFGKQSNNSFFMYDDVQARDFIEESTAGKLALQPALGNVGVGTTTPQWNFQVAGTGASIGLSDTAAGTNLKHWVMTNQLGDLLFSTSTDAYATTSRPALKITGSNGNITTDGSVIIPNNAGYSVTDTSGTVYNIMTLNNNNDLHLLANFTGANTYIGFNNSSNLNFGQSCCGGSLPASFVFTTRGPTIFNASTTEAMRIINTGNIAIGTTTTSFLPYLTIASSTAPQLALSAGAGIAQWTLRNAGGNLYISTTTVAGTSTTSIPAFQINSNGQVFAPSATVTGAAATDYWCYDANGQFIRVSAVCTVSARKYKKDIEPLPIGLNDLLKMQPVEYKKKDPMDAMDSHEQMGFIADDVAQISPAMNEMLVTYADGGTKGDVQGFRYDQVTSLIVQSIKDLNEKVEKTGGLAKRSMEEDWQDILIGLLIFGFIYQQYQIKKLKK